VIEHADWECLIKIFMITNFEHLLARARFLGPKRIAVANAQDEAALSAFWEAKGMGLVEGILFGNKGQITQLLRHLNLATESTKAVEIRDFPSEAEAVTAAVRSVAIGEADILLKGKTKTSTLLKAVLDPQQGLKTGKLLSDVFLFEDPGRDNNQLVMISDGGVTIAPDLKQKVEIIQNAVELAHLLGNTNPKVALLSAVETVTSAIPSTLEAAAIAKMNQRGQIKGCIVDGPLALDNAISPEAARIKGLESPVAGVADILIPPDIESANMLAKSTTYWAKFRLAHVIMGAKAPILIPSRADSADAKLLSIALGIIVVSSGGGVATK